MKMKLCGLSLLVLLAWTSLAHAWSYQVQWSWTMVRGSGSVTHYVYCFNGGIPMSPAAWVHVPGFQTQPPAIGYPYYQAGSWVIKLDNSEWVVGGNGIKSRAATAHNTDDLLSNNLVIKITCVG